MVKDSIGCMIFFDFSLEDQILYHTTLCRFRNEIVAKKTYERLLKNINKKLEIIQTIVKTEVIVDASITVSGFAINETPTP
ncbi:MAG: hypothetical protein ACMUEL_07195 [Flavobacteriales bacterium Tduv]